MSFSRKRFVENMMTTLRGKQSEHCTALAAERSSTTRPSGAARKIRCSAHVARMFWLNWVKPLNILQTDFHMNRTAQYPRCCCERQMPKLWQQLSPPLDIWIMKRLSDWFLHIRTIRMLTLGTQWPFPWDPSPTNLILSEPY